MKSGISTSTSQSGTELPDPADRLGEDHGAAIVEIVAVDDGQHRMAQTHGSDCVGGPPRLVAIDLTGPAGLTSQNAQALVHLSPSSIRVPVPDAQHS